MFRSSLVCLKAVAGALLLSAGGALASTTTLLDFNGTEFSFITPDTDLSGIKLSDSRSSFGNVLIPQSLNNTSCVEDASKCFFYPGGDVLLGDSTANSAPFTGIFNSVVTQVSVYIGDIAGDEDELFLRGFDAAGTLIAQDTVIISADFIGFRRLEIATNRGISRIVFGGAGLQGRNSIYADSLLFSTAQVNTPINEIDTPVIPLPASLPLLAIALGGLFTLRKRA